MMTDDDWAYRVVEPTHRVTWRVDGALHEYRGSAQQVTEIRDFMLKVSPLRRDDISNVLEIKERK